MDGNILLKLLIFHVLVLLIISCADGLVCYACALSKPSDPSCKSDNGRLINSKLDMKGFMKNCSENESYCMIEKITTQYKLVSYIRDCSNGYSFSYTQIDRLRGIAPNNASRCAFYNEHLVCVTLCRGDFCNGPQETSKAAVNSYSLYLLYVTMAAVLFITNMTNRFHDNGNSWKTFLASM